MAENLGDFQGGGGEPLKEKRPQGRQKKQALEDIKAKGVLVKNGFDLGTEEATIERQLGFLPSNVHSIAARAASGKTILSHC